MHIYTHSIYTHTHRPSRWRDPNLRFPPSALYVHTASLEYVSAITLICASGICVVEEKEEALDYIVVATRQQRGELVIYLHACPE